MKLVHPEFFCPIEFSENKIELFVVENSAIFSRFVYEMKSQIEGKEGRWVLSKGGEILSLSKKCAFILDPFSITLNEKRMVSALYQMIETEVQATELLLEWNSVYPFLMEKLDSFLSSMDYALSYQTSIEIKDFLKIMGLKFEDKAEDFFERLLDYFKLFHEVLHTEIFVLVNIKDYLDEEQLHFLYQESMYRKYHILLIERHMSEVKLQEERVTIIDKDACLIQ